MLIGYMTSLVAQMIKRLPTVRETRVQSLGREDLEKEMATHSSVLAWRIPGTVEPGGLLSMGSHRIRHNWSDLAAAAVAQGRASTECLRCSLEMITLLIGYELIEIIRFFFLRKGHLFEFYWASPSRRCLKRVTEEEVEISSLKKEGNCFRWRKKY